MPNLAGEVTKERAVITDDELAKYLAYEHPEEQWRNSVLERQTMACVSRMFGGVRAGDLHHLDWQSFDAEDGRFEFGMALRKNTPARSVATLKTLPSPVRFSNYRLRLLNACAH